MLDTFKARLKAKAKAKGVNLSQKRIDAYAARLDKKNPNITDEAEHDTLIEELDELVSFADVAKEDDRVRTLEQRASQKPADGSDDDPDDNDDSNSSQPGKGKGKNKPNSNEDMPAWAKPLFEKLNKLETEKAQGSMKEKLEAKLKDKNIPAKFYAKRPLPEKEEDLDAYAEEITTDWNELKQESNNLGLNSTTIPGGGGGVKTDNVDADIEAWANAGKSNDTSKK